MFLFSNSQQPRRKMRSMIILMHLAFYQKAYLKLAYSVTCYSNIKNSMVIVSTLRANDG